MPLFISSQDYMGSKININDAYVERSISAGVNYILSLQLADGSWREWELPPGNSTSWATAYIGYKLRCVPSFIKSKIKPHLFLASNWLLHNIFEDGGWGYNSSVVSDADSTAHAILCLISAGYHPPDTAFTHLVQYQSSRGGFSTYRPTGMHDSWTIPHPDVTPIALLAMLCQSSPNQNSLQTGTNYVLKERTSDFWWNSFWWNSRIYATEANLSFLNAINTPSHCPGLIEQFRPKNEFESALLISSLLYLNPTTFSSVIKTHVSEIITMQRQDGSWNEAPILRITRRECFTPWISDEAGPLFSDPNRLFTTATVVEALSRSLLM